MDIKDFETDVDGFRQKLGVRRFDAKGATQQLLEMVEIWASVGQEHLGGIIRVDATPEDSSIAGEVLGKKFQIRYAPIGLEGDGAIEASVTIQDLATQRPFEISRFLVTSRGKILSTDGLELNDLDYRDAAYKTLVALATRIIETPSKD
ncbi:TPA: hypothetical protein ACNV18_003034 [Pseudomonas putida]|uniref:hypothetical protein n=1 Tax=Pseudomonas putida TaxID=303 RepID=UPI0037369D9D